LTVRWFVGMAVALVGLLSAGPAAAAVPVGTARDTASTKAFIGGELGIDRAMLAHGPAELAAGTAYVASVSGDCGSVRLHLPRKSGGAGVFVLLQFAIEVGAAYDDVTLTSVRPAVDRIARLDEQLRFSDPALEWTVHGSTPALAALPALRPPDLCADVRRLQATKFHQITPAGRRFSKDALTLISGASAPGALIRRIRAYAPAAVATGLQRLKTLNHRVARLPVARVEFKLLRELFGKATTREGANARVRSVLGRVGHAQL
jgi:hypothetical protein